MSRSAHEGTIGGSLRPRGPIQLALTTRYGGRETVVTVAGELDILTVPRLARTLDDIVRHRRVDVVIDLTRTDFIDSLGLHALLNVQRRLAERSRRLTVICDPGPVRHSMELARLTDALGVVSSFAEYERQRAPRDPTPS
ncbi:MAG TPA: STAS domain-containing protein [Solirubrobacteraceae bacterium]|nr:STAS domain-containing protein [Solirubrobacteraceae bacterium]